MRLLQQLNLYLSNFSSKIPLPSIKNLRRKKITPTIFATTIITYVKWVTMIIDAGVLFKNL